MSQSLRAPKVEVFVRMTKRMYSLLLFFLVNSSCGDKNLFTGAATKDTDAALAEDARKLNNDGDFEAALSKFELMSEDYRTQAKIVELWASVYAGKCGFNFLSFFSALSESNSDSIFLKSMRAFTEVAVDPPACRLAQSKMASLGNVAARTSDQNLFLALLGFAKIGTNLRAKNDIDQDGNVDDLAAACTDTKLTDAEVREVFTGLGLVLENIVGLGSALGGESGDSQVVTDVNNLNATCVAAGADCTLTNPSQIDSNAVLAFRKVIDTQSFGIGDCTDDPILTCCP